MTDHTAPHFATTSGTLFSVPPSTTATKFKTYIKQGN